MKKLFSLCLIAFSAMLVTTPVRAEDWGSYNGNVNTQWLPDGRKMKLLSDYEYTGPRPKSMKWKAPKGSVVDGASIPRVFWSIIGGPLNGSYRNASVLHDVACDQKVRHWEDVHLMFYQAMRCSDVSVAKAKVMYWAVYHFGPRWKTPNVVERLFGIGGADVLRSNGFNGSSRWSSRREEWMQTSRKPSGVVSEAKPSGPVPPADPARVSAEDIRRFEQWIAKENPSLTELENKAP